MSDDITQEGMNKVMAGERISELQRLSDELNTFKWIGSSDDWDRAIEKVRQRCDERSLELIQKYAPELITADVVGNG